MGLLGVVNATAPVRICDNGGWTDTWFAGHGKVFNIAVSPRVEVQLNLHPARDLPGHVVLDAVDFGERYAFNLGALPGRHPLLEAAIDEVGVPTDVSVEVSVHSGVPAGCSTGTSAAATVALIGALDAVTPGRMALRDVASLAHRVETDRLGLQSGIQDQLCAAYGGVNFIDMPAYPHASVDQLQVPPATWSELEQRLVLVFLGRAHISSEVHDRVIASVEREGARSPHLEALRNAAEGARDAACAGDLAGLGRAMVANTDAQARLHPSLVSDDAHAVFDVARAHGALGWKVNGAGGEGGSVTLLCGPGARAKDQLLRAVRDVGPQFQVIPTSLSRDGLRVWRS
jgi:D-glycero-alpha-D-manno-heptose-7-phosphate kinase